MTKSSLRTKHYVTNTQVAPYSNRNHINRIGIPRKIYRIDRKNITVVNYNTLIFWQREQISKPSSSLQIKAAYCTYRLFSYHRLEREKSYLTSLIS